MEEKLTELNTCLKTNLLLPPPRPLVLKFMFSIIANIHQSLPPLDGTCNPDLRLRGHNTEGYGLSWSQFKHGHLLSCSDDAQICLWDINATPKNKALDALQIFKVYEGIVEVVAWHLRHEYLFGSVGDDQYLHVWDLCTPSADKPIQSVVAHQSEVVATGFTDKTVKLFDC